MKKGLSNYFGDSPLFKSAYFDGGFLFFHMNRYAQD